MFKNCTFGVLLERKFLMLIHHVLIEVSAGVKLVMQLQVETPQHDDKQQQMSRFNAYILTLYMFCQYFVLPCRTSSNMKKSCTAGQNIGKTYI